MSPWLGHGHKTWFVATVCRHFHQFLPQQILDVQALARRPERARRACGPRCSAGGRSACWRSCCSASAFACTGIHDPILDHPGWRQGDTASIARNFARLQYNLMYPQTTYNGPLRTTSSSSCRSFRSSPRRSISRSASTRSSDGWSPSAFSLGNRRRSLAYFARWLFASSRGRARRGVLFAVFPGSVYYGRTFMPDSAMVFFLTAALYATPRLLLEDERLAPARRSRGRRRS